MSVKVPKQIVIDGDVIPQEEFPPEAVAVACYLFRGLCPICHSEIVIVCENGCCYYCDSKYCRQDGMSFIIKLDKGTQVLIETMRREEDERYKLVVKIWDNDYYGRKGGVTDEVCQLVRKRLAAAYDVEEYFDETDGGSSNAPGN